jgi:TonB family protein
MSRRFLICILCAVCFAPVGAQDNAPASKADGTFCGLPFGISREQAEQALGSKGLPILESGLTDIVYDASSLLDGDHSGTLLRPECGTECEASFSPADGLLSRLGVECSTRPKGKSSQAFFDSLFEELTGEIGPPTDSEEQKREVTHKWQSETATIRLSLFKEKDGWSVRIGALWPDARRPLLAGVGNVSNPRFIPESRVEPVFPKEAREKKIEGNVILQAVVLKDGTVAGVEVLNCSRPGFGFEEAAIAAVSEWRYEPALMDGEPVDVYFTIFLDFKLS